MSDEAKGPRDLCKHPEVRDWDIEDGWACVLCGQQFIPLLEQGPAKPGTEHYWRDRALKADTELGKLRQAAGAMALYNEETGFCEYHKDDGPVGSQAGNCVGCDLHVALSGKG